MFKSPLDELNRQASQGCLLVLGLMVLPVFLFFVVLIFGWLALKLWPFLVIGLVAFIGIKVMRRNRKRQAK